MLKRILVVAAVTAGLSAAPGGVASADSPGPKCVDVPVNTVGAHVEIADREVHVPALSNLRLCAVVDNPVGQPAPVDFTLHYDCGFPCFTLVAEEATWTVVSTRATVFLTYDIDGAPTYYKVLDVPITVTGNNTNPACVAVGNPIPECPPDTLVVPVPAP